MTNNWKIGDLVHIPQSVELVNYKIDGDSQLSIPAKVIETKEPKLGIVTNVFDAGYVRIYYDGFHWSVKDQNVYKVCEAQK